MRLICNDSGRRLGTRLTKLRTVRVVQPNARAIWSSLSPVQCACTYRSMYSVVNRTGGSKRVPRNLRQTSAATRGPRLCASNWRPPSGKSSTVNSSQAEGSDMPPTYAKNASNAIERAFPAHPQGMDGLSIPTFRNRNSLQRPTTK